MEPGNLEARVAALETQVRDLDGRMRASERDAAAARVLAGAADRDVSEIRGELRDFRRATIASFNALREDMNDLRAEMNARFAQVDNGFMEMRGRFDATAAGQQRIVELIQGLSSEQGGTS
nr:hypothetical protein [Mycobacterium sp. UM_NZ2]